MAKREYIRVRIDNVETQIARWEAMGNYDCAEGLREFFAKFLDEVNIEKMREQYKHFIDYPHETQVATDDSPFRSES